MLVFLLKFTRGSTLQVLETSIKVNYTDRRHGKEAFRICRSDSTIIYFRLKSFFWNKIIKLKLFFLFTRKMSKIGILKLKKYQTFNGKGILRKYSNDQPRTKKVSLWSCPCLHGRFANFRADPYLTKLFRSRKSSKRSQSGGDDNGFSRVSKLMLTRYHPEPIKSHRMSANQWQVSIWKSDSFF